MPSAVPEGSLRNPSVESSNKEETCSSRLKKFGLALEGFGSKCFRGDPRTGAFVIGATSILLSLISLLEAARLDRANASTAVLSGYAGLNAAFLVSALLASLTDQKELTTIRPWFIFQLVLITGLLSFGTVILKVLIPPLETSAAPESINPTTPVPAKLARELRIAGWGLIGACGVEVWFLLFVWYNYTKLAHEEHMINKRIKVKQRNHAWVDEGVGFGKKQHNKGLFQRSHTCPVVVHDDTN